MKYLIASMLLAFSTFAIACGPKEAAGISEPPKKEPETKRVCIMVYDAQQKKDVEKCRTVKIREKHEGTPIPK